VLLSLFCGAGGLDLGFEQAGYQVALAFDIRPDSVESYNYNRRQTGVGVAHCADVRDLTAVRIDSLLGAKFAPTGIIGGPPCQSFSRANKSQRANDPRHDLPFVYAELIDEFNRRHPVPFFAFENVTGLDEEPYRAHFLSLRQQLEKSGFDVRVETLNAFHFGVPQNRRRLIMVGLNREMFGGRRWTPPQAGDFPPESLTVRHALRGLPEPVFFEKGLTDKDIPFHPNHWCMQPKSRKFTTPGALLPGRSSTRSFKTLSWESPSITVAYGNREVHIHPSCHRRLSVLEAMLLQGFSDTYVLKGSLSSQITQVSEAVPPPMAEAIAESILARTAMCETNSTLPELDVGVCLSVGAAA
jgi:DNA (cytosine-5)-methyltransferase 1